ncbi:alpha/beta hydrolase [Paraburkholderia sediminicola]|uniref:alpha/beta hydrolase n=1 Tax=Paraburkholderia sediminicola TaxID=458836 RepID=UPI0038BBF44C
MDTTKINFDSDGLLNAGTHVLSKAKFLEYFCNDASNSLETNGTANRNQFYKPFLDICDWAQEAGATSIVVGGSFVTRKPLPSDMDLLIFFAEGNQIPKSSEVYDVNGVRLDVQLLSEDQPTIRDAFLQLISTTRSGVKHGIVQIKFHQSVTTHWRPERRSIDFDIVKAAYLGRHYSQLQAPKGVVIPIHGIRTHADWMPYLSLVASTSGWAVAPYVYGYRDVGILSSKKEKTEVLDGFRTWLSVVRENYKGPMSIIAHSFGTYIVGRYLRDAKDIAEGFDAVVLCGSILNTSYDWGSSLEEGMVGRVLNTVSEKDEWVKYLSGGGIPIFAKDDLFGEAGYKGFACKHDRFHQISSSLLQHNNVFRNDVIISQWLPFLEMSKGANYKFRMEYMIRTLVSENVDALTKGDD